VPTTIRALKRLKEPPAPTPYTAQDELTIELAVLDYLEQVGYAYLTEQGVSEEEQQFLMGYMKRLWTLALKYENATYAANRNILLMEYVARGHVDLENPTFAAKLEEIVLDAKTFKLNAIIPVLVLTKTRVSGSTQSFASGSADKVHFDAVDFDVLSEWNVGLNRFIAQNAGYYLVHGLLSWSALIGPTAEYVEIYVKKNGVTVAYQALEDKPGTYTVQDGIQVSALVYLDVGEYVELWANQHNSATGTRALNGGSAGEGVNLSIVGLHA
jgi:hypothetical protein